MNKKFEEIVSLCKRRGFVYPTSEIYGGIASSYDYGPLGVQLLKNIKDLWWKEFIEKRADMVGIDSQIILHPKTWEASGHVGGFDELVVEDIVTNKRYRVDHLIENFIEKHKGFQELVVEDLTREEMAKFIVENKLKSPDGNTFSQPKKFDLLMRTSIGVLEGGKDDVYLRGETAQGIFSNFKNILDSTRVVLPFGVGQIGKSFRNEVTLGQFVFRTFEFEQAEIEYFFDPEKSNWEELLNAWKENMKNFVVNTLGVNEENTRWRKHTDKERSHYSKETFDLDYKFPFGWKELWGVAYRTNYDLNQHIKYSGAKLQYTDPYTSEKIVPHVIEPAVGVNRMFFMVLDNAYTVEETRVVLKLSPKLAPYKIAVFPLVSNKEEITKKAKQVFELLSDKYNTYWDDRGNIGKRYKYQDEIGTPYCITIDYDTLETGEVTVRDRDTMLQEKILIKNLDSYCKEQLM